VPPQYLSKLSFGVGNNYQKIGDMCCLNSWLV